MQGDDLNHMLFRGGDSILEFLSKTSRAEFFLSGGMFFRVFETLDIRSGDVLSPTLLFALPRVRVCEKKWRKREDT